jgi:hypothetical protein
MGSEVTLDRDEADPISPVAINHSVDEVWADQSRRVLVQRYNFLDYHFERNGRYCRARVYLEDANTVTLYGPFVQRGSIQRVSDAEFANEVATYLRRRFRNLTTT